MEISKQKERPIVQRSVLSRQEEDAVRKRLDLLKDMRDGKEIRQGLNFETKGSPEQLDAEIKDLEHQLDTRTVQMATGAKRSQIESEIKQLTEVLQKDMPTWLEYSSLQRKHGMNFVRLRNQIMKWETDPVRRARVARWKHLRRQLNPQDPDAANTMQLFPST
jgi:hypothetical protein